MKKNTLSCTSFLIACALLFVGCQQNNKEISTVEFKTNFKVKRKVKDAQIVHKKGIEHIADYQREIRKGIDAEKSTYTKGYLIREFNKAQQKGFAKTTASLITPVFKERGPNNVPGRSRGIAIDPKDEDRWFIGTVGGGVWRTEDAGTTWASLTDFKIPNLSTATIVMSQTDSDVLYVGTGEPFGNLGAIGGSGVFKTTNGGASWQSLAGTAVFGDVGRIIINPTDDKIVLIATTNGIYRTADGGTNWIQRYSSSRSVQDLDADPTNFNIQYGSVNGVGLVKSTDAGLTWNLVFNTSTVNPNHSRFETAVSQVNPSVVVTCAYSSSGGTVSPNTDLYISRNSGASFTNLTAPAGAIADRLDLVAGQGWYDNIVLTHPFDENIFYVGGVELFKVTVNDDDTFTALEIAATNQNGNLNQVNTNVHVDQHGLAAIKGTNKEFQLILASDGGVFLSNLDTDPGVNDADWSNAVAGKNSTQFYAAAKQNGFDNYLAGAQDNGSWISSGGDATADKTYSFAFGGDGFEAIWHYNKLGDFIVTSQYNNIARYTNSKGALANFLESGDSSVSPFYSKLANADNNPDAVFAVTASGVWRSTNFAETWSLTEITDGFSSNSSSALNVKVSTADPNVVWAGATMQEDGSFTLHVSEDNGQSFAKAGVYDNPNNTHNLLISGIGTSYIDRNRAYALFSAQGVPKILMTEDLGGTWVDVTGFETATDTGFPDVAVHTVLEMPFNKDILWAGTDIGLFQTENGGKNWSMITSLPAVAVYDMKVVNDQVVIATYGRGIWSATISELETYTMPSYFAFAAASTQQKEIESLKTTVSYTVPTDDVSSIKIFVDNVEQAEITQDFSVGVTYTYETTALTEGRHELGIQAFDATNNLKTPVNKQEFAVINFDSPGSLIEISAFQAADVFVYNDDFVLDNLDGKLSTVVLNNNEHPYSNDKVYTVVLKKPLTLAESNKNFTYEDFAIVEPYTDDLNDLTSFFDFVTLEASSDLITWKTLDIYDARRSTEWLLEYSKGDAASGNDALFREQKIVLTESGFAIGETVVFRFRLVTDGAANSYGWAIKSINASATANIKEVIEGRKEFTIYPTVSKGNFTLYAKNTLGFTNMSIFDITGKQVYTKEVNFRAQRKQEISVSLKAGIYIVHLVDENNKRVASKIVIE